MQKIGEIINIANKVFVKNIKKQIKEIKNSQFRDEVKNNLSMAGELLIDSIYMFNKKKTIAEISILRNVYEMTLKGIVLDKNEEIFNSVTDNSEKYILLDVAFECNKYPNVIEKIIKSKKLNIESNLLVKMPSIESILGDKLTVLAPRTTGISYNSEKELELMKQLYDVDKLFNEAEDIYEIRESFINIANREIKYRKLKDITYEDVLMT